MNYFEYLRNQLSDLDEFWEQTRGDFTAHASKDMLLETFRVIHDCFIQYWLGIS